MNGRTAGNLILMTAICIVIFWMVMALKPAHAELRMINGRATPSVIVGADGGVFPVVPGPSSPGRRQSSLRRRCRGARYLVMQCPRLTPGRTSTGRRRLRAIARRTDVTKPFFAEGTPAMLALEDMVDRAGRPRRKGAGASMMRKTPSAKTILLASCARREKMFDGCPMRSRPPRNARTR